MATYYIDPAGSDTIGDGSILLPWLTLGKATSTVTSGNTIHVNTGTYTQSTQCNLATGVSIEGEGVGVSIINSTQTGTWSNFIEMSSAEGTNGNQHISGLTLDGGYVSEASVKTWVGLWITGRSNVTVYDCTFSNWKQTAMIFNGITDTNPGTDVGYTKATGNSVYNCDILNCAAMYTGTGQGALMIGFQDGFTVHDCLIQQDQRANFTNGWPIKYWNQGWLDACKIYNNTLIKKAYAGTYPGENGDWDFCIELFSIAGLEIYGNTIQGAIDLNYNYEKSYGYGVWIHDNIIGHATQGTKVEGSIILEFRTEAAIIENNTFYNNTYGISYNTRGVANNGGDRENFVGGNTPGGYSYIVDNVIQNNLFYNFYQGTGIGNRFFIGVISEGTDDPQINNMKIYNNTMVADDTDPFGIGIDLTSMPNGDGQDIYVQNNITEGITGAYLRGSTTTNIDTCFVTNNNAYQCGNSNTPLWPGGNPSTYTVTDNIIADPLFVGGTDYTLQSGSPCIDAGIDVGLPYSGIAPDIGYAEYGSGSDPTADAGPDQNIYLPTTSIIMAGSGDDPDGTIVSQLWTKISGPSSYTITDDTSYTTTITDLVEGTYVFRLTVTDNDSNTGNDDMQVIVNPAITLTSIRANIQIL